MWRTKKSIGIISLVVIILMTTGFGCKGLSGSQQAAIKPVTLEYWTVFSDVDAMRAQIAKYKLDRPYINVNVRQFRVEDIYPRLIEALAEDKGPDIISVSNRSLGQYVSKLVPAPASVTDSVVRVTKGTLGTDVTVLTNPQPVITLEQLDSEYVQTVKRDVVRNEKIYGLPLSLDTMAIYYNKDLLDRAGIPEPPTTWEEFQAAVKKITKYDKTTNKILQSGAALGTGRNVPGVDDILSILFQQSGIKMSTANGRAVFNQSAVGSRDASPAMNVLTFYTDFANPARDTYTWNVAQGNALDAFVAGKVGFFFGYSYHNNIIKARAPQLNFRLMPMLQLTPETPVNTANYWIETVLAKSKHQNEAWGLINFLTHSGATKEYLKDSGRPTALRAFIADQKEDKDLSPFVSQVLIADSWYRGNNYPSAAAAVSTMVDEWLAGPPESAREQDWRQSVLDRAADRINQTN